jgi:ADP-ribosyl-[dinitrogen reductase] hydrolase
MIYYVAVGDANGSGFEFAKQFIIDRDHNMQQYYPSRIDNLVAGQYTDDTQMTLANAELMLKEDVWTPELIADSFLHVFKRDERDGYAGGFQGVLERVSTGQELIDVIHAYDSNSTKNGAAMRSVPLGLIADKEELLLKAEMQSKITHDSPEGIFSSQAVALSVYYFKNKIGTKDNLQKYLEDEFGLAIDGNKTTRCACDALETIDAVITVLNQSSSMYEIIDKSILMGGDTDSVASIACGIASMSNEFDKSLPSYMYDYIENGTYGRDYIIKLDEMLMEKFSK